MSVGHVLRTSCHGPLPHLCRKWQDCSDEHPLVLASQLWGGRASTIVLDSRRSPFWCVILLVYRTVVPSHSFKLDLEDSCPFKFTGMDRSDHFACEAWLVWCLANMDWSHFEADPVHFKAPSSWHFQVPLVSSPKEKAARESAFIIIILRFTQPNHDWYKINPLIIYYIIHKLKKN